LVTSLADGGWLVTWSADGQDGEAYGVYQQRYDADGATSGAETLVNSYTPNYQEVRSVAALADGGWLVTWHSYSQDGDGWGIYQQRYASDGATSGTETRVNSYTTNDQSEPSVTALADGGWLVTWQSNGGQDGDGTGIYQQRFDANGATSGAETLVNSYTTSYQHSSSVTALADGGWLVTWQSFGQDGDAYGIQQQRYDADGIASGTETLVNSYAASDQGNPSVTALADGGWLVTWQSYGKDGSGDGIYQQRYDADGAASGTETLVNSYTASDQSNASATALADGGWLVTWQSNGQDGSGAGIYQQRYDADGAASGTETLVNSYTASEQANPAVTALADGGWLVTWQSYGQDGSGDGIYQRHFAADVRGGALADILAGTNWDETLIGFNGNDRLDGKAGDDILIGGFGNDTYVVNSAGDDIQEFAVQGVDTVIASVSFSLAQEGGIENLTLAGAKKLNATGSALDNRLTGNSGNNLLNGAAGDDILTGGNGKDSLTGGIDSDRFVFKTGHGKDTITDFDALGSDHDIIDLTDVKSITSFGDLKANHMEKAGSAVVIDAGHGDTITLEDVRLKNLDAGDFLF
jgi:hypothetical protein